MVALFAVEAPGSREVRQATIRAAVAGSTFITPVFCVGEFWRVATEPRGYGTTPESALAFLKDWLRRAPLAHTDRRFEVAFLRELASRTPRGADVFDLAIATLARQKGASELWTADARFPQIEGLAVQNPAAL